METENEETRPPGKNKVLVCVAVGFAVVGACVLAFTALGALAFFLPMLGGAFAHE